MRNYYVLSNGRLRRDANTLSVETADGKKRPIPIEDVSSLYLYGEVDINTKLLNFLAQKHIPLHVFNYYGFYSGSYYPREYLHSGYMLVNQVQHYADLPKRMALAQELVRASAHSILRNVSYYSRRRGAGEEKEPTGEIGAEAPATQIPTDEDAEVIVDAALEVSSWAETSAAERDPILAEIDFDADAPPLEQLSSFARKCTTRFRP